MNNKVQRQVSPLIHVDKDKCNNCHNCISICPVKACIDGSGYRIDIIHERCIGCGRCIIACTRGARTISDDTEIFFDDIKNKTPAVLMVAPSAVTVFDNIYKLNGYFKSIGVLAVFDVSFGAELASKSYIDFIKRAKPQTVIAQPCPALVSFCEIYHPELLKYLAPVHSPMLHTAIMIRKFSPQFNNARIGVVSPCLAKRREFEETGIVSYNITMVNLKKHFEENYINLNSFNSLPFDGPQAERAVSFSSPGGLLTTVTRDIPELQNKIRKIEGGNEVYKYLVETPQALIEGNAPQLVDCLSCTLGCNGGLGTGNTGLSIERLEAKVKKRMNDSIRHYELMVQNNEKLKKRGKKRLAKNDLNGKTAANDISTEERQSINELIDRYWRPKIYTRKYIDKSAYLSDYRVPSVRELQEIYIQMKKRRDKDFLNCAACGYGSCKGMAVAIFNKLNRPENCHQYLSIELELRNRLLHETFGRYLSDDIVNKLLDSPAQLQLGGMQRNISVLMSDIRGFSNMAESMDSSKVVTLLNHYFSVMVEIIRKYKGTVIEFMGDGILMIFGAPAENPNHADDAIACALEMQNAIEDVNVWNKENSFPAISIGIGVNTGECIVGNIGSETTMKYNVIGRNVNIASRIESYTTGAQIYISESARLNAKALLNIRQSKRILPKGLLNPITVHLVEGIGFPYNIDQKVRKAKFTKLKKPLRARLFVITEKIVNMKIHDALIIAFSETGALIQSKDISVYDNIRLRPVNGNFQALGLPNEIFAKVARSLKNSCWLISIANTGINFYRSVM